MPDQAILPPCTFLRVGQSFAGSQNVSNIQKDEAWEVNVRLQGVDMQKGSQRACCRDSGMLESHLHWNFYDSLFCS
uniref:Uncharacterized protein n=1 Tax=Physcomitrium patens TaxID=3218 RepID=A0A2K1IAV0_PHYPA|nr:hypothetical protein PHYPA_030988 [Physcomitrium patens]